MKPKILLNIIAVSFLLCFAQGAAALPTIVYSTDFASGGSLTEWSDGAWHIAERGAPSSYLGNYSLNDNTTLTLTGLPYHNQLSLEFDLYLFGTWDGEDTTYGKDYFSLKGDITGSWTFTNHQSEGQSYPGSPDIGTTGRDETHVYLGLDPTGTGDKFLISHTADTFSVTFGGPTTQSDEWWGIDNVRVSIGSTAVPEPATMLLLGFGLVGLSGFRRKFKR